MKPDTTIYGTTELQLASYSRRASEYGDQIATLRCFLNDDSPFTENNWGGYWIEFLAERSENGADQWLLQQSARLLPLEDLIKVQRRFIQGQWMLLSWQVLAKPEMCFLRHPYSLLTKEFMEMVDLGQFRILDRIFFYCYYVSDSFIIGDIFIQWLIASSVDVEECMKLFMGHGIVDELRNIYRKVVFEPDGEQGWRLGFEWTFDPEAPGYQLVSEYQALRGCENLYYLIDSIHQEEVSNQSWPFSWIPFDKPRSVEDLENARFTRRLVDKARKERARSGEKVSRSRMPGTYVW